MPTASKPPTTPRLESPVEPPSPPAQPFLRFYHSESLRAQTLTVLTRLEQAPDPTRHRDALADIVMALTESGMEYYFLRPLKRARVGFVVEQSANFGMTNATRVLGAVIRNIIGRMDTPQLLIVCSHMRQLME